MTRLTQAQIDSRLRRLPGWKREGDFIVKDFTFGEFMDGIGFVDAVAGIAERLEHHPDVHIRWTTIRLEIQTHDEGGVTPLDLRLATEIEAFASAKRAGQTSRR